jgi:predicted amidohydrolase
MQPDLILKNGRVIDPSQGLDQIADVIIADGKIAAILPVDNSSAISDPGAQAPGRRPQIINASGINRAVPI